ncbi:Reverse transcriptase RNA-dependent DNA polymerase [Arabidopsis suecica]|uniref:Reverse transcriptase RNA-dependent DNA polymerase n=1 Tax=Arabidopsis suecica TaxID=45249 RepID=A0A8T1YMR5_ARASU|nr:Reverse transcriptase RNA-dependent DNA polymerase [Arabidopsis suecica]
MGDDKMKLPQFDGHWDHWSEVMENFFRCKGLWRLVETGFEEPPITTVLTQEQRQQLDDAKTNDHKVKHYLYQSIDRVTFEQILDRRTSKIIWDSLKRKFGGNERVKKSLLQKLRRDFEVLEMKESEKVEEYFTRVLAIANQMRSNGETMSDSKVVEKILRTLSEKFTYVVVSIEESKDIESISLDELQSSLVVHEQKFKKIERGDDQVLNVSHGRGMGTRGRGFNGRGRGRGRGRIPFNKSTVECYHCHRLGHFQYECPKKEEEANYAGIEEHEDMLLMAFIEEEVNSDESDMEEVAELLSMVESYESDTEEVAELVLMAHTEDQEKMRRRAWFLDSGCSNHMSGDISLFSTMDSSFKHSVKLGNNKKMEVIGKGNVKLMLSGDRMFLLFDETSDEDREWKQQCCLQTTSEDTPKLWHERYGHLSHRGMKTLQSKTMVRGLPVFDMQIFTCSDCLVGKQPRKSIPKKSLWRAKEVLDLVHSDICGPINPVSNSGKKYVLCFIDDCSKKAWVYFLKEKSEAFIHFKMFKSRVETETGKTIKCLRTDRGGEYTSHEFSDYCKEQGIRRQLTTAYTPQQNGIAERKNRTVMNMVRSMLSARKVPKIFWPEVVKDSKGYRLYNPKTKKIVISRDVVFEETKSWTWEEDQNSHANIELTWNDDDMPWEESDVEEDGDGGDGAEGEPNSSGESNIGDPLENVEEEVHNAAPVEVRLKRVPRPPSYLNDYVTRGEETSEEDEVNMVNMVEFNSSDPTTFEEAEKCLKWREAMNEEINSIIKNQTWVLTELPKGVKCIGVKWIYKTKLNEHGEVNKYKARLVAKGYSQEHGIDYTEVYAPVARMDTVRTILATAAQKAWDIYQLDVKSAFLHGFLLEDVYIQQPKGYVVKGCEEKVYKLHKALYGLKQAPRAWFSRIEEYFLREGFQMSQNEETLFLKTNKQGNVLFVSVYVDDLIYTGDDVSMMREFKTSMENEFDMTDLGKMRFFLGIEVLQTPQGIHISQSKYALEILRRFEMENCNPVFNPMVPGSKLDIDEGGERVDDTFYKQIIGSLLYITTTRPDLQFSVSLLSRFMSKPTVLHLQAAKRVLRYLKGTMEFGIWYKGGGNGELLVYTDSDFAGDVDGRRSTSGYVFLMDDAAVAWSSKKQPIVTLSTTEAEYVAASVCACQAVWFNRVLEELGYEVKESTVILCDNTSTIKLSKNQVFHGRCKHIGVRFHFLRELVKDGVIRLEHCGSQEQVADILTKPLKREVFENLRNKLGICSVADKLSLQNQA